MSKVPAYELVYQQLKKDIIDGEYSVGELLPTEGSLEKRFDVSRTTIRRAMELLSRESFVSIKQGRGTQVLDYKTQQDLNLVTSVSETLRRKGYDVKSRSIYIDTITASSGQSEAFEIEGECPLIRIQRVRMADERPIAIMHNYLLPESVPGIEGYVNRINSLYEFLERKYQIVIDSAKNVITAKVAGFSEAEMLGIKVGDPLLHIKRMCFMEGKPICLDSISIVGDFYELEVFMEGRYREKESK